jgi:aspartate aminotransferase
VRIEGPCGARVGGGTVPGRDMVCHNGKKGRSVGRVVMVSKRAREVELSGIRRMFEAAPPNSINLGLGEPDFEPPKEVIEEMVRAVRGGLNHYGPSAGIPALREKIAEGYRDREAATSRENVVVTGSASEGLMAAALALYDPGDEVLVPNPGFVLYAPHARLAGAVPVPYSLTEANRYLPDLAEIERKITSRTHAIVVNSPSNPTGAVFPRAIVDRICDLADRHDLTIVSDEVYEKIVYGAPCTSFWGRTERVVIANSFSKSLAMTGWRIGYLLAPKALAVELNKVHYHIMACPPTPTQVAVLAGLESSGEALRAMVREFRARRSLVLRILRSIPGMDIVPPQGAFYAFPKFAWPKTATEVASAILARGVITTPGDAFGSLGAAHLRISFAASRANLKRGLAVLREYAEEIGAG